MSEQANRIINAKCYSYTIIVGHKAICSIRMNRRELRRFVARLAIANAM
jgi:hypothetical protein